MTKEKASKKLVKLATENLKKPYKYGAKLEEAPAVFDCSSFIQYLYHNIGIELPRTALDQALRGRTIEQTEQLEIGDLIFIKGSWGHYNPDFPDGIGHVAVYIGGGKTISARWKEGGGSLIEEPVEEYLNRADLRVIKRIL